MLEEEQREQGEGAGSTCPSVVSGWDTFQEAVCFHMGHTNRRKRRKKKRLSYKKGLIQFQ